MINVIYNEKMHTVGHEKNQTCNISKLCAKSVQTHTMLGSDYIIQCSFFAFLKSWCRV